MAADIDRRRLTALDPEPEELVVAAQVDLRPEAVGLEAEVALPLKGDVGRRVGKPGPLSVAESLYSVRICELLRFTAAITCSSPASGGGPAAAVPGSGQRAATTAPLGDERRQCQRQQKMSRLLPCMEC